MAALAPFRHLLGARNKLIYTAYQHVSPQLHPLISVVSFNQFGNSLCRNYGARRNTTRKTWKWFKFSGDLAPKEPLNKDAVKYYYKDIPEIKSLSPEAQQIFSLNFADRMEKKKHEINEMMEKIFSSLGPDSVLEKRIAMATLRIRCMKEHVYVFWKDKRSKSDLNERIAKRRKWLKRLKKLDRDRFIWICQQLKLKYYPVTKYSYFKLSKRGKRKKKARKQYFAMKIEKIVALREKLEKEKMEFDEYKKESLEKILKDLKELNLQIEDVYDPKNVAKQVRDKKEEKKFVGRIWY